MLHCSFCWERKNYEDCNLTSKRSVLQRKNDMLQNETRQRIVNTLSEDLSLYKIILFGSFAYGNPTKESDIDLIVVTNDDSIPGSYEENIRNYLRVSSVLRDIKKDMAMDLIVYTKPMYDKFVQLGSMFSKEILKKGEILYERNK